MQQKNCRWLKINQIRLALQKSSRFSDIVCCCFFLKRFWFANKKLLITAEFRLVVFGQNSRSGRRCRTGIKLARWGRNVVPGNKNCRPRSQNAALTYTSHPQRAAQSRLNLASLDLLPLWILCSDNRGTFWLVVYLSVHIQLFCPSLTE